MRRWTLFLGVWLFAACAGSATEGNEAAGEAADASTADADAGPLTFVDATGGGEEPEIEPEPEPQPEPECTPDDDADNACDDGAVCTTDTCEDGLCVNMPFEGTCDDEDACTEADLCAEGVCVGSPVEESHCDDANDCTADSCDAKAGCRNWLIDSHACRPDIQVSYPLRAAGVVWEDLEVSGIVVTGTVTSGAGPIVELLMNGEEVSVGEDGTFSVPFTPTVGGNTLDFFAKDSMNTERERVQAFHWSPSYLDPKMEEVEIPCDGIATSGVCVQALSEASMQWSPAEVKCQEWGGHLAVIESPEVNAAVQAQLEAICGEDSAWIGLNDNLKEGYYLWSNGQALDGASDPEPVLGAISGVGGDPLDGTATGAIGLDNGGGALQDGTVGGGLGAGVYLSNEPGGVGSDYMAVGEPVVLDYDFGAEVTVAGFLLGLYDYQEGAGHPDSATELTIDLGTSPGANDVAEGLVVAADLSGAAAQMLSLGDAYTATHARVTVTDNGYAEGVDGGSRVGMSEAVFDAQVIYTSWNEGEPNDWDGDEDVVGMLASGLWNDFNGDQTLNCCVCTRPTAKLQYTGHSDPGMGIFLGPELIDDGDHSQPPDDLGTVFEMLFGGFDLGKLIPSPAATGLEAAGGIYDLYITDVLNDAPTVALELIDGGWAITAELKNVSAPLEAYKTGGSWLLPGEITGTLYIDTILITSDVMLGVTEDHQLDAWAENSTVTVVGASIDIDGILGGLIEGALEDSLDDLLDDIEVTLAEELGGALAPLLVDALGSLAFGFDFELPSLNPEGDAVQMKVATDFSSVDFGTDGDVMYLRSIAIPSEPIVLHESNGTPAREGCGLAEQSLDIAQEAPMEIVMNDDTINMIFYAAWRGGFLEFDLPPEALGDVDLEGLGVKDLEATVSGLLAPTVSDCKAGELLLHLGDIRLDATMEFLEKPLDLVAYAAFDAKFEILAADGKISFGISDVQNIKLELTVVQEDQIEVEWVLAMLIEENLVPALVDGLTGESLGGLELPNIEMDAAGTPVEIGIEPLWVKRSNGNSIVGADLAFVGSEDDDLAEGDLSSWVTGCEGECETSLVGDTEITKVGSTAVRVETDATGDLWVGVESVDGPSWSVAQDGTIALFLRTETTESAGWEVMGGQGTLMLELRDVAGAQRHIWAETDLVSGSAEAWTLLEFPVAGGDGWLLEDEGADLTDISRVAIHMNTAGDAPYKLWVDGLVLPLGDAP